MNKKAATRRASRIFSFILIKGMKKRYMNMLLALFILVIVCSLYISLEGFESLQTQEPWCILLTTCVKRAGATPEKTKETLELYKKSIDKWLETGLPIIVIDSSDYEFKEYEGTSLKVCHFMCQETKSSSVSESLSILYAINNCNYTRKYKNIIKITGRYYIEDFPNILKKLGDNSDLYIQHINNSDIKWQHSEVFGFNKKYADEIFNPIIKERLFMEKQLWTVSHTNNYTVQTFPQMPNAFKVKRGGDGLIVDPL